MGAAVVECLAPDHRDEYACPLCTRLGTRTALERRALNVDHVPPREFARHMGVRPIEVLTCKDCNSRAGTAIDADLARLAQAREFAQGRSRKPIPIKVQVPGIEHCFNALGEHSSGGFSVTGIDGRNPPTMSERFNQWFQGQRSSWSFTLHLSIPDMRRVGVGMLRAAYLTAFAACGYRYILGPAFGRVREQIRDPRTNILDPLPLFRAEVRGIFDPAVAVLQDPFPAVMVCIDQSLAIFPPDSADTTWLGRTWRKLTTGMPVSFQGVPLPWPRHPTYRFDR